MIEINLLPGKKKPAAGGGGFKFRMPDFGGILANITNPWLVGAVVAWVLVLGAALALFVTTRTRLAVLNSRLESVRTEKRRYDAVIAQKRQSERMRDSLVTEIGMIREIDGARYIWPHILDQVAKALPPYTWLTTLGTSSGVQGTVTPPPGPPPAGGAAPAEVQTPPVFFQITGSTVDIQAYTTFLRQLSASPWFTDVVPASSQTVVEQDRPVTAFTVSARFRVADSVYIHTTPLARSLR